MDCITWKIGGEAGFGIMSAGTMLARAFSRQGHHVFATNEYPSLIRGGHNLVTVRIARDHFFAMNRDVHILVALNKETVELHKGELNLHAVVVFDPKDGDWKNEDFPQEVTLLPVPFTQIVGNAKGDAIMRNTVALGASIALLGADFIVIEAVIADQFKRKEKEIIAFNVELARTGFQYIKDSYPTENLHYLSKAQQNEKMLVINGSEAVGVGAVQAGLKFAAIYPMTPINSLITFLADHAKQVGIVYKQPEDELAGINMALGASMAGVRSMVATSGGGFALMVEGLSLAGMVELPIVIDMGMRVGPATGMPTYTEQGELLFVIWSGHGEFARIVLAPSDAQEAYLLTIQAFHLADRYHIPVIILTDKYLNESQWVVPVGVIQKQVVIDRGKLLKQSDLAPDDSYKRYRVDTEDGVSPRSVPGMKHGFYIANSYEHNEVGYMNESVVNRSNMVKKRLKKIAAIQRDITPPTVYGDEKSDMTFVSWGSTRGPVLEAIKLLKDKGKHAKLIHFTWLFPFPVDIVKGLFSGESRLILVEQNATGQLGTLIRQETGITISEQILKFDGRPIFPEEIVEYVLKKEV